MNVNQTILFFASVLTPVISITVFLMSQYSKTKINIEKHALLVRDVESLKASLEHLDKRTDAIYEQNQTFLATQESIKSLQWLMSKQNEKMDRIDNKVDTIVISMTK